MADRRGNDFIHAQFARSDCSACPHLSQCTSAKGRRRTLNFKPKELYEALRQNRRRENAEEFKEEYRNRAGTEGTISQGVRAFGLRRSRYMGISKTRLQHLAAAAAINLERVSDWLAGIGREQTRRSAFTRVMQPLTAQLLIALTLEFANSIPLAEGSRRIPLVNTLSETHVRLAAISPPFVQSNPSAPAACHCWAAWTKTSGGLVFFIPDQRLP
jgi:transposase